MLEEQTASRHVERFPLRSNLLDDAQQTEQEGTDQTAHNLLLVLGICFYQLLSQQGMILLESLHARLINMNDRLVLQVERDIYHITDMQHTAGYLRRETDRLRRKVDAEQAIVHDSIRLADDNIIGRGSSFFLIRPHSHASLLDDDNQQEIHLDGLQLREVAQVINDNDIIISIANKLHVCQLLHVPYIYFFKICHIAMFLLANLAKKSHI